LASVAVIQSSLLSQFSLVGARFNLILLVVISWSLLRGAREGIVWGFIGGLALDFLSGATLGNCAFTLTLVAYFASLGQFTIYRTSPVFPSVIALTTSIIHDCVFLAVFYMTGHAVAWYDTLLQIAMPTALLSALLMPLVHRALAWLHRRTMPEELEL
jgi:rod shape-determining protein MreD